MSENYLLDENNKPVPTDLMTWAAKGWKRVAEDYIDNKDRIHVSTVFLGLDHSFGEGPPLLFETMIFGGPEDGYQDRYSTWDEAIEGHKKAVEIASLPF